MSVKSYNTNLASEYYVLSMLYRYGANAYLTLGNKKTVDILVEKGNKTITIDVKGLAGKTIWPLDNFSNSKKNHYIALVSFLDKINNCTVMPEIYIVPSGDVSKLLYINPRGTRQGIQLNNIRKPMHIKYLNNWKVFT